MSIFLHRAPLVRVADRLSSRARGRDFTAEALCHPAQVAFIRSTAKRRSACCSRRSGKTRSDAQLLLEGTQRAPFVPQLYVTLTRSNAKEILWPDLLELNELHGLGGEVNLTDLSMRWPNGGAILLRGANNEREIAKIRGHRFKRVVVDEGQSFPDRVIRPLIDDVVGPTLLDYDGELIVTGTPGPAPVGFFWDITMGTLAGRWERHAWTLADNPYLPALAHRTIDDILAEIRAEHGWTVDDPTYQREYLGRWCRDENALVFRWGPQCEWDGVLPPGQWHHVIGVDLGHEDADAIVVLAWSRQHPAVYLVHEHVAAKQGVTELGDQVLELHRRYRPKALWVDTGGLGRKIAEELRRRWGLPVEAAEKTRKMEHVELLNDALRTGRLKALPSSRFAEDAMLVQWDADARARGVLRISDRYHSDVTDACLYAYRACRGYLYEAPPAPPVDPQVADMERRVAERVRLVEARKKGGVRALLR